MSSLPDIIPGYPNPTKEQVQLFQRNNHRKPDGIIGRKTRSAIWRTPGTKMYTHFAWHRMDPGGAEKTKAYCAEWLNKQCGLPLAPPDLYTIFHVVSSGWDTGLDYLSDQDGATMGIRRLAAGTLGKFISSERELFGEFLCERGLEMACANEDSPNSGGILADQHVRLGLINAVNDRRVWDAQLREFVRHIDKTLEEHPWAQTGREITLLMRIANSGSRLDNQYVQKYGANYDGLKRGYTKRGGRGPSRIRHIESLIPHGEFWR